MPTTQQVKNINIVTQQVKDINIVTQQVKDINIVAQQVKDINIVTQQVKDINIVTQQVKDINIVTQQVKDINIVTELGEQVMVTGFPVATNKITADVLFLFLSQRHFVFPREISWYSTPPLLLSARYNPNSPQSTPIPHKVLPPPPSWMLRLWLVLG